MDPDQSLGRALLLGGGSVLERRMDPDQSVHAQAVGRPLSVLERRMDPDQSSPFSLSSSRSVYSSGGWIPTKAYRPTRSPRSQCTRAADGSRPKQSTHALLALVQCTRAADGSRPKQRRLRWKLERECTRAADGSRPKLSEVSRRTRGGVYSSGGWIPTNASAYGTALFLAVRVDPREQPIRRRSQTTVIHASHVIQEALAPPD